MCERDEEKVFEFLDRRIEDLDLLRQRDNLGWIEGRTGKEYK